MRSQDYVRRLPQLVIDRQRLLVVDVEPGISEPPCLERLDNGFGIDNRAARCVDQDRAWLHQPDFARADQTAAAIAQNEVHREYVGATEQLILFDPFDALRGGFLGRQVLAPGDRLHAEGEPDPRPRATEPAEPQQSQRLARDAMADMGLPAAVAHDRVILGDAARRPEDQAPGELGRVLVAAAPLGSSWPTGAAHRDAAVLQRRHV